MNALEFKIVCRACLVPEDICPSTFEDISTLMDTNTNVVALDYKASLVESTAYYLAKRNARDLFLHERDFGLQEQSQILYSHLCHLQHKHHTKTGARESGLMTSACEK